MDRICLLQNTNVPSFRSGPSFCPSIEGLENMVEILVPSGSRKSIKFKAQIIGQFIVQTRFICQFNIEGHITTVNAELLGDTIYCDSMVFSFDSKSPNSTVTLAVIWGGSRPLDNPNNVHGNYCFIVSLCMEFRINNRFIFHNFFSFFESVLLYQCRHMANNCESCLKLPEKFKCGWCPSTSTCEVGEQCSSENNWINHTQTCQFKYVS